MGITGVGRRSYGSIIFVAANATELYVACVLFFSSTIVCNRVQEDSTYNGRGNTQKAEEYLCLFVTDSLSRTEASFSM